uniref:(California timema) hypothetical protein n=1 Tax=Timema californicum TaxID=61474 RepID=A0A7R9PFV8_TIMCA|nr:unnamed protein product [Timema californicum]
MVCWWCLAPDASLLPSSSSYRNGKVWTMRRM